MSTRHQAGFTVAEVLTAIVALIVIVAVAVPMWRTNELRGRRDESIEALLAVQAAQDEYFGKHARYANEGLGIKLKSRRGYYQISVSIADDALSYTAIARVVPQKEQAADSRCAEMRIDQNGRRFAVDAEGVDRSADCWR